MKVQYISMAAAAMLLGSAAQADIVSTIEAASSGTTVTCSGTYSVSGKIHVPAGVTVKGPATFKFTNSASDGFVVSTSYTGVTLSSLTVTGAYHGIMIYGNSNKVTSCTATANYNTGIICENTAASNTISGCLSYNNADSSGGNADGYGNKQNTGTGNVFSNCTCYNNSDDGFDFERSSGAATCTGCVAYSNGYSTSGKTGNGEGFKMGYKGYSAVNVYTSCTAHHNTKGDSPYGFSTNNGTAKIKLTTCKSYSNGKADALGNCVLSNCTMQN